ncbi:hypothetical protein P9314_15275 [Paenibacillus validus]|uniref:hypothetical protein n=1 Tax=Paenibacillus TaxID=44249 RepID=UPI000FD9B6CB|nr:MULTISPECIES: hypothetical protein [Paenibacillus]MED4602057.1 hypothetical protein [Paenibacillus validus]MED4607579.1 hypothetical protein [Paenibacillus validus]
MKNSFHPGGVTMRAFLMVCSFLISISVLSSCTKSQEVQRDLLHVKPVNVFEGDAKKFQPFMGPMSGAVKLNYKGDQKSIRATAEIWENGVKKQTIGEFSTLLRSEEQRTFDGEFIVSMKELDTDKEGTHYMATVAIIHEDGSSSTQFRIDSPVKHTSKMPVTLGKPIDVPDNEEAAVWGMQATNENSMRTIDFTPESLKNAKWVILFKINMSDDS